MGRVLEIAVTVLSTIFKVIVQIVYYILRLTMEAVKLILILFSLIFRVFLSFMILFTE